MCGIAGLIAYSGRVVDPEIGLALARTLEPRGPDDIGYLGFSDAFGTRSGRDPEVLRNATMAFIHRRLSIIDLSEHGWQPMSSADGRYHIVYNGEIYNYIELRAELEAAGCVFRGNSDTEVLLQAFAQWGSECLPRLTGMFSFAILDRVEHTITMARDGFGIKPLYYSRFAGGFAFASEIKALVELPYVKRSINPQRMFDYLRFARTDAEPQTMFAGIEQLMPGQYAVVSLDHDHVDVHTYWRLEPKPQDGITYKQAAEQLRELFIDSVRLHLRSDVPVGTCLSGGIDSSAIVMTMRHLLGTDGDIHTFSYLPRDPSLSEERWIDIVNNAADAIPHKVRPMNEQLVRDLDAVIWAQDEPFAGTSIYAQHCVFQAAHENAIKVMLDGQGADELLGGYQGASRHARLVSLARQRRSFRAIQYLINIAWHCPEINVKDFVKRGIGTAVFNAAEARKPLGRSGPNWINHDWFASHGVELVSLPDMIGEEALRSYLHFATTRTSLPHLLRYEDRNSMAFSVESRVPFLTPAFAEFMLSLPEHFLVDYRGTAKSLFRTAMRGIVPDAILDRRDKIGFTTPLSAWLGEVGEWVESVLQSEAAHAIPGLQNEKMLEHWNQVRQGERTAASHIWRCVNFIRWAERFQPTFD